MLHEREMLKQELDSGIDKPAGSLSIGVVPTAMLHRRALLRAMLHARTRASRRWCAP
jgi:hypothetical protein